MNVPLNMIQGVMKNYDFSPVIILILDFLFIYVLIGNFGLK